jgi:hypothetical protein
MQFATRGAEETQKSNKNKLIGQVHTTGPKKALVTPALFLCPFAAALA